MSLPRSHKGKEGYSHACWPPPSIGVPQQNKTEPQELWVKTKTAEGKVYFYNAKTKESVWNIPDNFKGVICTDEEHSQQTVYKRTGPTSAGSAAQAQGPIVQLTTPVRDLAKAFEPMKRTNQVTRTASLNIGTHQHRINSQVYAGPLRWPRIPIGRPFQDRGIRIQHATAQSIGSRQYPFSTHVSTEAPRRPVQGQDIRTLHSAQSIGSHQRTFSTRVSTGTVESNDLSGLKVASSKTKMPEKTTKHKLMVSAIDFGTTYSGWAFSFKDEYKTEPTKVHCKSWNSGQHISMKAPTAVLIKPDGKTIEAFGYNAENRYAELVENEEHKPYYYFQRFKMRLYDNKTLQRNTQLKDINNKQLPAKTVFSLVIGFLRKDMLEQANLQMSGGIDDNDIQWVLTVPAIWNVRAKQFMRECAIEAGMKSKDLLIALEPEAASLYCKHLQIYKKSEGKSDGKILDAFKPGAQYMIVDAGGGTIDIIVHKVNDDGSLEEVAASSGGNWGGTNVDTAFLKLVSDVYGEDYIQRLKDKQIDDYLYLLREIELKKRNITPDEPSKIMLKVPLISNEMDTADKNETIKHNPKLNGHVTFKRDKIVFDRELMEAIFSETSAKVIDHIQTILSNVSFNETDVIIMVGGFSESKMLLNAVKMAFKKYTVILPPDAGLSVLKGAVIFGHSMKDVKVRVSPYTYGFSLRARYDPSRYDDSHLSIDENGNQWAVRTFCRLVKIHERISIDDETPSKGAVPQGNMNFFTLRLFASKASNPLYVDDTSCFPVGDVFVKCTDDDGNVSGAKVSLKFGGTEVEARAVLDSNGKLTSTIFNFLD